MPSADWYFDFVSPFAYLQCEQLAHAGAAAVACATGRCCSRACSRPAARRGPPRSPPSARFTYRFVVWQAKRLGVPLKFPPEHPFNPLPLLRLAIACDCDAAGGAPRIFRFVWRDGRLPDLPIEWADLTHDLGVATRAARIAAADVKDALRRNTDEAIERGVFGVPTLAIGERAVLGRRCDRDGGRIRRRRLPLRRSRVRARGRLPVGAARRAKPARRNSVARRSPAWPEDRARCRQRPSLRSTRVRHREIAASLTRAEAYVEAPRRCRGRA